jgi:riboflavin kinase
MLEIKHSSRNILKNEKKRGTLIQNVYLNLPDLQFFNWCNQQYSINQGGVNTIDQWFYDYGIREVILRRIYILSFLNFIREASLKAESQKFIRFGNGGLINQLTEFIKCKI